MRIALILFCLLLFIGQASAWVPLPVTYYNNWNNSGVVSDLELDSMNPDKYPYKWNQDLTNWYFYKNEDTLTLPKAIFDEIIFYPDKISANITTTKGVVAAKSKPNVPGQRYIPIPDSLLKLRFVFDHVKPDVLINNGTYQWYANPSTYWYSNVDGQIRFNFYTAPYVSLNATDKITFMFNSWLVDGSIVSGLGDIGLYSAPTVFTNNSILYLISGEYNGAFYGFNWTGTTWQSDTTIVSGLGNIALGSIPTVFTNNSILYLISGEDDGIFHGFNWIGSTWQSDTTIVSGLRDVGSWSTPTVFTNNSILYLISGESKGIFFGFNWTGTTWQSDTTIVSGLGDVGYDSRPTVFTNNSILYLIAGEYYGGFAGFNWTGTTWQSDTTIVSGLGDVGTYSRPTVFTNNSILYLIAGEQDGVFNGFNRTLVLPSNPRSNITSWGNSYTNNNTLSYTLPQNTNVTFNATANQTLTTCSWVGATQINCTADTFAYKLFDTAGTKYVNLSGSNANGSTLNTVNWTIVVEAPPAPTTFNQSIYNTGWQTIFINATQNMTTIRSMMNSSNVLWVARWNATSQKFETYKAGWTYRASNNASAGDAIYLKVTNNDTVTRNNATGSYNWNLSTNWNLIGLDYNGTRTLAQINTSINSVGACEADLISYIKPDTMVEYIYTCGLTNNATVAVSQGQGFWMNATTAISRARSW